ncbi:MAG: T9SS type A sorting domain-containing protein [Bacteroidia bacterium]|nr:T9SS type A sorting domain-containing protein [Bacteroidia bacterium]
MNFKILSLLFLNLLNLDLKSQVNQIIDAKVNVECLNCHTNFPKQFQISLDCRFAKNAVIPNQAILYWGDTMFNPIILDLNDSGTVNCEMQFNYGPYLVTFEDPNRSYFFKVYFEQSAKVFGNDSNFKLLFEIFDFDRFSLKKSSSPIIEFNTCISKHLDLFEIPILQSNISEFFTKFNLIVDSQYTDKILFKNNTKPLLTIYPKSLTQGFHRFKISTTGQIEEIGGEIQIGESFHSIFVDSLIKPISDFTFLDDKFITNNTFIISTKIDTISVPFKIALNGYDASSLMIDFKIHGRDLNHFVYETISIVGDTLFGILKMKSFDFTYKHNQYLSLLITSKENCNVLYSKIWDIEFDSLTNNIQPLESIPNIKVHPNPFLNTIEVSCEQNFDFELLNSLGIRVYKGKGLAGTNEFELNNLPIGIYIAKITAGNKSYFRKLVKQE